MSNQRLILFWLFPYHSPTLHHHPSSSLSRPRCDCGRPDCWLTAARFSLQSSRDERLEKCRQPLLTGRKINQRRLLPLLRRKARGQHVSPELCNPPRPKQTLVDKCPLSDGESSTSFWFRIVIISLYPLRCSKPPPSPPSPPKHFSAYSAPHHKLFPPSQCYVDRLGSSPAFPIASFVIS